MIEGRYRQGVQIMGKVFHLKCRTYDVCKKKLLCFFAKTDRKELTSESRRGIVLAFFV